jgi:hypothetical protein
LDIFDVDARETDGWPEQEIDASSVYKDEHQSDESGYERMIKTMVGEFAVQLDRQRDMVFELRKELQEKDVQLRLLPDLQKQLEEKEKLATFESVSLRKQNAELVAELEDVRLKSGELATKLEALENQNKGSWWRKWFLPREV